MSARARTHASHTPVFHYNNILLGFIVIHSRVFVLIVGNFNAAIVHLYMHGVLLRVTSPATLRIKKRSVQ